MQLRKVIKQTQRWEPEMESRGYGRHLPAIIRPAFPPPFLDFNPDLEQAAFPTLEDPRPGMEMAPPCAITTAVGQRIAANRTARGSKKQPAEMPAAGTSTARGEQNEEMNNDIFSNGSCNPTYLNNMRMFQKVDLMSDDDLVLREMESSDEEQTAKIIDSSSLEDARHNAEAALHPLSTESRLSQKKRETLATWSSLTIELQVAIYQSVCAVLGRGSAAKLLFLTVNDVERLKDKAAKFHVRESSEDQMLAEMRTEQLKLLLADVHRPQAPIDGQFHSCFINYLPRMSNSTYMISTRKEIEKGRRFVKFLGLDSSFAGQWEDQAEILGSSPEHTRHELVEGEKTRLLKHGRRAPKTAVSVITERSEMQLHDNSVDMPMNDRHNASDANRSESIHPRTQSEGSFDLMTLLGRKESRPRSTPMRPRPNLNVTYEWSPTSMNGQEKGRQEVLKPGKAGSGQDLSQKYPRQSFPQASSQSADDILKPHRKGGSRQVEMPPLPSTAHPSHEKNRPGHKAQKQRERTVAAKGTHLRDSDAGAGGRHKSKVDRNAMEAADDGIGSGRPGREKKPKIPRPPRHDDDGGDDAIDLFKPNHGWLHGS